ncbi:MAG: protein-L-isoaspartate(D-aspartate) O-methyltransferase [Rhodocyclaceae bacterium]|nr:protein-L-isoaspartate(D-aspartate) O-methyltransferase [Rhodocyclaceae bacterium]
MSTHAGSSAASKRGWRTAVLWLALLLGAVPHATVGAADMARERQAMVDEVASMARAFGAGAGRGALDPRVLAALGRVPRHEFVSAALRSSAYANRPLPIGHGQTISQPYIVAVMTDYAKVGAGDTALEIGTGSGYQAAVLAELGVKVWSIEIVEPLAKEAAERLRRLGYANVATKFGDGYHGWPEHGPFDAIVVTAAASHVPPPLLRQLKPGGRMVIPVGASFQTQQLLLVEKRDDGTVTTRQMMPVRFVPLTGGHD